MKVPSDLEILKYVYKEYYRSYSSFMKGDGSRETKIFVPIEINKIAKKFRIDEDIIFGRLYYYLDPKYSYKDSDGSIKSFFVLSVNGKDRHCVNFPLMSSILAGLQEENNKFWISTTLAIYATVIAVLSIVVSLVF